MSGSRGLGSGRGNTKTKQPVLAPARDAQSVATDAVGNSTKDTFQAHSVRVRGRSGQRERVQGLFPSAQDDQYLVRWETIREMDLSRLRGGEARLAKPSDHTRRTCRGGHGDNQQSAGKKEQE